jgi:hypothetical protein
MSASVSGGAIPAEWPPLRGRVRNPNLKSHCFQRRQCFLRMITKFIIHEIYAMNGAEMTSERLSAVIRPGALVAPDDIHLVPALIAGDQAAWRYLEFFAANIRNANTRRAYARAC